CYNALRRGDEQAREALGLRLAELDEAVLRYGYLTGGAYGLADVAYLPWIVRARQNLAVDLGAHPAVADWLERLSERPAVAPALARLAPERMRGLVLAGSRADADPPERKQARQTAIERIEREGAEGMWQLMKPIVAGEIVADDLRERLRGIALEQPAEGFVR